MNKRNLISIICRIIVFLIGFCMFAIPFSIAVAGICEISFWSAFLKVGSCMIAFIVGILLFASIYVIDEKWGNKWLYFGEYDD